MHLFEAASTADARRAAEMLARAGRRALDRLAYEDAAERFERALEALELAGAEDEAGPVLLARGDALLRAGEPAAARAAFTAAARARAAAAATPRCWPRRRSASPGSGIAIVDLDAEAIARLEEALERGSRTPVLRSRAAGAPRRRALLRARPHALGGAQRRGRRDGRAPPATRARSPPRSSARHVALWRPDRVEERLAVAGEMIAAAREAGDRHAELQARNWRVTTSSSSATWRPGARRSPAMRSSPTSCGCPPSSGTRRCGRRSRRCSPAATTTQSAWRAPRRRQARAPATATRSCSPAWCDSAASSSAQAFDEMPLDFVEDKIANSPAGPAYRGSYAWVLAGLGETERARSELDAAMAFPHAFDANWLSLQAECAEATVLLDDPIHALVLYERLAPYAGRPATAGRAAWSSGAVDRLLGGLAALLGRQADAVRHLKDAIRINQTLGCLVWREHAKRHLTRIISTRAGG